MSDPDPGDHQPGLRAHLFGTTCAFNGQTPVDLGARKQRAVFALLALNAGSLVTIEQLEAGIWGEEPPPSAKNAVQVYVTGIRRVLGIEAGRLRTVAQGYRLAIDPERVDVLRFERMLDRLAERSPGAAGLRAALALWGGEPLGDMVDFPFAAPLVARLTGLRATAREDLIDAELTRGRHEVVIEDIEQLIVEDPYRERGWRLLMLALYRSGRQADALAAFQRARKQLDEDLGLEPSPALVAMERAILLQDPALDPSPAADRSSASLPALPTPMVGRVEELREIGQAIGRNRLVTITGPGGAGKTRLAIEAGRQAEGQFPDGVWFVDFSATFDRPVFVADLSRALGAPTGGEPLRDLAAHIGGWQALIILDNLEQMIDAALDVAELLRRAGGIRIMTTSRIALRVAGEHVVPIGPLGPADANALFMARAAAVTRAVPATSVADAIVTRVEGLPLAIELAAASCRGMAAAQVLERLNHQVPLPSGPRDLPARHQSLRATVSWSIDLLPPEQRDTLKDLSVFRGPFALEAAIALIGGEGDTSARISALVEASLLIHEGERYRMLGTIRDIVRESMEPGRRSSLDDRHATWMTATAAAAATGLHGPDEREVRIALTALLPDVRAALEHLLASGENETAAAILIASAPVWFHEGRFREFALQIRAVSEGDGLSDVSRAEITTLRGIFAKITGDGPQAEELLPIGVDGLRRYSPRSVGLVNGLCHLAALKAEAGERDQATALADEAVAVARETTDAGSVAMALDLAGYVARLLGDGVGALRATQEAVLEARRSGSAQLANALAGLAESLSANGRHEEATRVAWEAIATAEAAGSLAQQADVAAVTSPVLAGADPAGAVSRLADAIARWLAFGAIPWVIDAGVEFARLTAPSHAAGTARLLGGLASRSGADLPAAADIMEDLRATLGEEVFARERAAGTLLDDDAISRLAAEMASGRDVGTARGKPPAEDVARA